MSSSINSIQSFAPVVAPNTPNTRKIWVQILQKNSLEKSPEKDEFKKDGMSTTTKVVIATTLGIGIAALVDYFAFKGKYSKKLINYVKNLFKKPTTQTTPKPPTTVTSGTTSGITNAPTTLTQAEQTQALNKIHEANALQRAELNSIKNNARGAEKLEQFAANIQKENAALNKLGTSTITHANGNVYHIKNGKVVKVDLFNHCKDGTLKFNHSLDSELKIAKHLSKHNISFA